ncbi:ATP-binding protein [Phenylobacterium sp.]|uniref:hybrid sensor histidine kinase/response regulator n=1 Tax=Phenylobacterium sp. TaxID=1871053 RepID=UPI00272F8AEF|nr:ATP-binding protein [Phenylobacterium sp.]MDP1875101.1 ATP-binding protein [Phenylobacterium sp.]
MPLETVGGLEHSEMRGLSNRNLLAPAVAIALAAMAVFVLSLVLWSRGVDSRTLAREEELVRQGLVSAIGEVEAAMVTETTWDEVVDFLDNRRDLAWADANLNDFYALGFEFSELTVLDPQDQLLYHRRGRTRAALDEATTEIFEGLLADVRAAELARAPLSAATAPWESMPAPIQASGFAVVDGGNVLATATLIQPDTGVAMPREDRGLVMLTVLPVREVSIDLLAARYQLNDLRTALGQDHLKPGDAQVRMDVLGSDAPLILAWTPQRPGALLLRNSVLPILAVLLTFGAVGAVMVARGRAAWRRQMEAQRTQTEFLANMSHEIRTPLNGVCAVAAALESTTLTPVQRNMVEIIRSSGISLERLLSDLLDVARMESGAVRISSEAFNLAEAARTIDTLLRPRALEKGLSLDLAIAPEAEARVMGDPVRFKQVLANLLTNAIKFTETGRIGVSLTPLPDGRWRLKVDDTGMGFDPARKAELFKRFSQGDASIGRRFGGMGLGLAISRELVELMGGEIDAEGRPGDGASFWVDISLPPAEDATQAEPRAREIPANRPLRILVADDHPVNRQVVEVLLAEFDVELVLAENGLEACQAFETAPFDMVLMDMQMPVMDGLTAIRNIRAREDAAHKGRTPIVMLTANTLPEHQAASLAAGADLHMPKPIEPERLIAVLQRVAEGQGPAAA